MANPGSAGKVAVIMERDSLVFCCYSCLKNYNSGTAVHSIVTPVNQTLLPTVQPCTSQNHVSTLTLTSPFLLKRRKQVE